MTGASDAQGGITSFLATDEFLRRVHPVYLKDDRSISPAAFQNTSGTDRMSVNWERLSGVEATLEGYPDHGVASITAEVCWKLDQQIQRTPVEGNPSHCDVVGQKPKRVQRVFAKAARWLRLPDPRDP